MNHLQNFAQMQELIFTIFWPVCGIADAPLTPCGRPADLPADVAADAPAPNRPKQGESRTS